MKDWLRSLGLLGTAFLVVVVVTLGLAEVIVPTAEDESPDDGTPEATAATVRAGVVGGTLEVTGDRNGPFVLERELTEDRYGLAGVGGAILFEVGATVTVDHVRYDGLEFFVDPDGCTVTPGERHEATGVTLADIHCEAIEDVRDNGTIGLHGTVGMAADLFGLRGNLPETGGTINLGDETLTIAHAELSLIPNFIAGHARVPPSALFRCPPLRQRVTSD